MFNRAARAGLIPGLIVSLVLASALLVPTNQGRVNLVCAGYGYGSPCAKPDVIGLQPGAGTIAGGTRITITGTDFNNVQSGFPIVKFGAVRGTVVSFTDTKIIVISPAHAEGLLYVTVTTAAGISVLDAGDQFRYVSSYYCAIIDLSRAPTSWTKGQTQKFYVYAFNCGTKAWVGTGYHRVDMSVRFTTVIGSGYNTRGSWLTLTYHDISAASVLPNQSVAVAITLTPNFRGSVKLEAEMIQLHQFWFGRYVSRPTQFPWVAVVVH